MATRSLAIAALVLVCATRVLAAAELATDAERTYGELRVAKDAKSKLMADRWYGLIRLQEWNDLSGKFSTTAKYVEHDPDLAWVKLRVIKGTGANRVVKDVTIPVAKLSKTCQSRVRQISVLREKVITAAAEAGKEKEEDGKSDAAGEMEAGRGEEPPREEIALDQPGDDDRGRRGEPLPVEEPAAVPPAETSAPVDRMPLPRQMPPLPTPAATPPAAVAPVADDREQGASLPTASPTDDRATAEAVAPANLPDDAPWRTNYDAFRANFTMQDGGRVGPQLDWGSLEALKQARDVVLKWEETGSVGDDAIQEIADQMAAIGEFTWETTLIDGDATSGDWTSRLNLPPLPEPLSIRFILDTERATGNWQDRKAGDRVRFVGRFFDVEDGTDIVAAIRFPEPATAVEPAPPAVELLDDRPR